MCRPTKAEMDRFLRARYPVHTHTWQPWPDRPGWWFCPHCPAMEYRP